MTKKYFKRRGVLYIMPAIDEKKLYQSDDRLSCFYKMVINKEKREKMYRYFDSQYEETKTDKEILDSMTKRRQK